MTPQEILTTVENFLPSAAYATLCTIEKGCKTVPQCSSGSTFRVVDFDRVKETLCEQKRQPPFSSVDALTVTPKSNILLFVEIKSWKKVAIHPVTKEEADDKSLKQTAEKFKTKLSKKIHDSFEILNDLTELQYPDESLNWAVVFVSDLDTDPLSQLSANISALAAFPTEITKKCNDLTAIMLGELPNVTTYYTGCHEFDRNIYYY